MNFLSILIFLIVGLQVKYGNTKDCGTSSLKIPEPEPDPEFRISGGTEAEIGAWPWVVAIEDDITDLLKQRCGGVLINSQWVLTSAQCISQWPVTGSKIFTTMLVATGHHNIQANEEGADRIRVNKILFHEDFDNRPIILNDIALLRLAKAIDIENNDAVNSICLPDKDTDFKESTCFVAGWGKLNKDNDTSFILHQAQIPFIDQEECTEKYSKNENRRINDNYFCAGTDEAGACYGDSGAPFICQKDDKWYVVGLASTGQQCHDADNPTIFARVQSYLDWIARKTRTFDCGIQLLTSEPESAPNYRILGGTEARVGAWPWVVEIQEELTTRTIKHCGGVLISSEWVLTNAVCIKKAIDNGVRLFKDMSVAMGYHNLNELKQGTQQVGIEKAIFHPDFTSDPDKILHDIVLLKLKNPVDPADTDLINPICLPDIPEIESETCFLTGWGDLNSKQENTSTLQETEINLIDQTECASYYAEHSKREIIDGYYFCAGTGDKGFCGGDEGSPLVCSMGAKWYLFGLTSGGGEYCAAENNPTIFNEVISYLEWIKSEKEINKCGVRFVKLEDPVDPVDPVDPDPVDPDPVDPDAVDPEPEEVEPQGYRIQGGKDATKGAWPWVVELQYEYEGVLKRVCGGALIKPRWVLTSALCVWPLNRKIDISQKLMVAIGYKDLNDKDEQGGLTIGVSKEIIHYNFRAFPKIKNDIALLRLKEPAIKYVNNFINTICLPGRDFGYYPTSCYTAGWGYKNPDLEETGILQEAEIPIIDQAICKDNYEKINSTREINYDFLCAGNEETGACKRDTGTPLFCEQEGIWYLVGITSGGVRFCSDSTYPTIYVRVTSYLAWISSITDND